MLDFFAVPKVFYSLWVLFLSFPITQAMDIDSTGQKVEFYPSSLIISHSTKPLLFYSDTKLMNLVTKMKPIELGPKLAMNTSCAPEQKSFFTHLLTSLHHSQKTINRLLSAPAFSNLLECDSYLRRYFAYTTGLLSRLQCSRGYRSSLQECKLWAIQNCRGMSMHERMFLTGRTLRNKRNIRIKRSWMCHAWFFGLFRAIYQ